MAANYDDAIGWVRLDGLLTVDRARSILDACERTIEQLDRDLRVGDKPAGGTRRLADVTERIPETADVAQDLEPVVASVLDGPFHLTESAYRCPQPGFGAQKLHADDVPRLDHGPNRCATAIVPLVPFTADNGATRVVPGSNLRPDLQRRAGDLESHPDEIALTGPVGTGFVFSGHLLHSGTENRSSEPRPALQFVFRLGPGAR